MYLPYACHACGLTPITFWPLDGTEIPVLTFGPCL